MMPALTPAVCAVPATGYQVQQAGAKPAAAAAMQQVLTEARELIRASLLNVAAARDEAVAAQRVLYRLTRHLFELDMSLRHAGNVGELGPAPCRGLLIGEQSPSCAACSFTTEFGA